MQVVFEFCGGPFDGRTLDGDTANCVVKNFDIQEAIALYWETNYGEPGSEFYQGSPAYRFQQPEQRLPYHLYRVSHRLTENDESWIVARHVEAIDRATLPPDHNVSWMERLVNLGVPEVINALPNFPYVD